MARAPAPLFAVHNKPSLALAVFSEPAPKQPSDLARGAGMLRIIKESIYASIDDEALTRGAAIAFYTVTSIQGFFRQL